MALSDSVPILSKGVLSLAALLGALNKGCLVDPMATFIVVVRAVAPDEIVAGCVVVGHVECAFLV